ncbi:MAG: trypsin-like peptidase domain-containing protein [Christensenellaceae bacterium]|jgi:serine protease Do|nr:trypsin-like peptidase domain-containing protein [Christensenellaceae bacterium]
MEYNDDWKAEGTSPTGSYSAQSGYIIPEPYNESEYPKKRRGFTWVQFIAGMLVVALLSGGLSAYFVNAANQRLAVEQPALSDSVTVEDVPTPGSIPNDIEDYGTEENASQRLKLGVAAEAANAAGAIAECMPSVVGVYTSANTTDYFGQTAQADTGSGSGVILTDSGYIVTNNHVIENAESVRVYLQDGTEYPAKVVGADSYSDLAILKIKASGLPAATLGNSGGAIVGDTVYAIGNPLGVLTSSVSKGIISGLNRTITVEGHSMSLLQTDAAVNPGNSGGGLFNESGELLGVVNAKSYGIEVEGIGFAIPVDSAKPIIADLIDLGYVTGRPFIGINMQDVALRTDHERNVNPFSSYRSNYVSRVQVTNVLPGSAAQKGGVQVNDIITALNYTEVTASAQLSALLYEYKVGDTVTLSVLRGTQTVELSITLDERSN